MKYFLFLIVIIGKLKTENKSCENKMKQFKDHHKL